MAWGKKEGEEKRTVVDQKKKKKKDLRDLTHIISVSSLDLNLNITL